MPHFLLHLASQATGPDGETVVHLTVVPLVTDPPFKLDNGNTCDPSSTITHLSRLPATHLAIRTSKKRVIIVHIIAQWSGNHCFSSAAHFKINAFSFFNSANRLALGSVPDYSCKCNEDVAHTPTHSPQTSIGTMAIIEKLNKQKQLPVHLRTKKELKQVESQIRQQVVNSIT